MWDSVSMGALDQTVKPTANTFAGEALVAVVRYLGKTYRIVRLALLLSCELLSIVSSDCMASFVALHQLASCDAYANAHLRGGATRLMLHLRRHPSTR